MMARRPSVAGMFYPANTAQLKRMLETFFSSSDAGCQAHGIVSPHAGYPYSGRLSALAFSAIPRPFDGTLVIIAPSHAGYPTCTSALAWDSPLGTVSTDAEFIRYLDVTEDDFAISQQENSLEVQIPFVKFRYPDTKIVPVLMGDQGHRSALRLAEKILEAQRLTGREIRLVASSDFSHYVPDSVAKKQDLWAIEPLLDLDIAEFYRRLAQEGVTACGYGPISVMVEVCRGLGSTSAKLLEYATSGDVTGDRSSVVGYAAIAVV